MATDSTHVRSRSLGGEIMTTILINAVAPLVVFNQLRPHMSELHALMVAALLPLVENVIMLVRHRRLDAFGSFVLGGMALTGVLVALGGSPKLLLVRESLLGCGIGIAMLGSLLLPRPLAYYLAGHFIAGSDDERRRRFRERWALLAFRRLIRHLTLVVGLATVLEAAVRTYLVFHLPTARFLGVSPFIHYGLVAIIVAWVIRYTRQIRQTTGLQLFSLS
jgi:hypothetical protein